jgi:hypothetical protein
MMTKIFPEVGGFEANSAAEKFARGCGLSIGEVQGPASRGLLYRDYGISKWRNLRKADIRALHSVMRAASATVR